MLNDCALNASHPITFYEEGGRLGVGQSPHPLPLPLPPPPPPHKKKTKQTKNQKTKQDGGGMVSIESVPYRFGQDRSFQKCHRKLIGNEMANEGKTITKKHNWPEANKLEITERARWSGTG